MLIRAGSMNKSGKRSFAGNTPGAVTVENVDLSDLVSFARTFDLNRPGALDHLGEFADEVMMGAGGSDLASRVRAFRPGRGTTPTDAEQAGMDFLRRPGHRAAVDVPVKLNIQAGVRIHRPAVLACCIKALNACVDDTPGVFAEAAVRAREEDRLLGRPLPKRAVGSTLLLKGLEAEAAVLLDTDGMEAAHLYVAITRGSRRLVVCSATPFLSA